ncbi:MAG TPA: chlorite dismutase family protein [Acidimicrobiales bacterium]|nr:chlorite dismutase family protein [Acidimicrobiales bacterium]
MSTATEHQTKPAATTGGGALPGLNVMHLFCSVDTSADRAAIKAAIVSCESDGCQVITVAMLGHKADLGVLTLGSSTERLRRLQTDLTRAGCAITYSYISLTEISEYSGGVPEAMKMARLRPNLPPEGLSAFCFYPMSKRRLEQDNWFRLSYEERLRLMMEHGASGRNFRGRVLQLVTGSTGLDDYEWGVTLFGKSLDDLKDCVYQMRFDEASARYADFGVFLTGIVKSADDVLDMIGSN